jgi:hypothetical protein
MATEEVTEIVGWFSLFGARFNIVLMNKRQFDRVKAVGGTIVSKRR